MKTENIIDTLAKIQQEQDLFFLIDVLGLSTRVRHTLLRGGVATVGEIINNWDKILEFKNMGNKGVQEIIDKLDVWYQRGVGLSETNLPIDIQEFDKQSCNNQVDESVMDRKEDIYDTTIEKLVLPGHVYNMLKQEGINNVGQIYAEWKSLGSRLYGGAATLQIIQRALALLKNKESEQDSYDHKIFPATSRPVLENGPSQSLQYDKEVPKFLEDKDREETSLLQKETAFDDYFNTLFELSLSPRYLSIIELRYGLKTGNTATLEEVAKHFGLSRERIRQIEDLATETIRKQFSDEDQSLLFTKLRENIETYGGLISKSRLLDILQDEFADSSYSVKGVMGLVSKIFNGEISLNKNEVKIIYLLELSGWSTSFYDKAQILQSANKILEILSIAKSPMQWKDLFSALVREIGILDERLACAIALCMSDAKKIQHQVDVGWSKAGDENRYDQILSAMKLHNEKLAAASSRPPDSPKTKLSESHTVQPAQVMRITASPPAPPDLLLFDWEKGYASHLVKVELIGEIPLSKDELDDISLHFRGLYKDRSEQKVLDVIEQYYPASFLVFMVGHGVYGYNGGDFWQAHELALGRSVNHTDFGKLFEKLLQHFGKPLFHELQKRSLRYVSLVLAHGGVPSYCLKDFFNNIVRNTAIRPQLLALEGEELIEELFEHTSYIEHTDKPVLHFMEYGGRTAANLLDRSRKMLLAWQQNQTLLSPEDAGLPAHLTQYFEKWVHENKNLALERGSRNRLKRPLLSLDPWGLGVFLYLPSQPVSALNMSNLYWKVEAGDYREELKVRTQRKGDQIETREITLRLNDVPEKILVQFSQGENSFNWKINGYSSDNLILAFDPVTGQLQNHVLARETWLMYPSHFFFSILAGEGNLLEVLPDLPGEWSRFKLECWDLAQATRAGLFQNNAVFREFLVRGQEEILRPSLDGGKIVPTDLEENSIPVYSGAPPSLRIPLAYSEDIQAELSRWQIQVDSVGVADPEVSSQISLADLPETICTVLDNIALICLGVPQFLNTRPTGIYQVAIKGPLGRDTTITFEILPECEVTGLKELYIPDRGLGPEDVSFSIQTSLLDGVDSLDGTDGVKVEAKESGLHHIWVPAEINSAGLIVRRETINRQFIRLPIYFRVKRLRWRFIGGDGLLENWSQKHLTLSVQELLQEESPLLIIDLPGDNGAEISLQMNLLNMQGNIIQQLKPVSPPAKRLNRFWRFDLSKIKHSIEMNDSSIFRVDLVGVKNSTEECEFTLPALVLTREIQIMRLKTEVHSSLDQYHMLVTWQEKKQLRSRALILWSLFRPWQSPIIENIPDSACGAYEFSISKREYAEGLYRMQMVVVDPWVSSQPPSLPPALDLPGCYQVELSPPHEYLKKLEGEIVVANHRQATPISNYIEASLIQQHLGDMEARLYYLEICCRNLQPATSHELLALRSILVQINSTSLEEKFGAQIILPEVLKRLYKDMMTGEITLLDFTSILKSAPHSKNWTAETCEILVQLEDPKIRFRSLAQLVTKDIVKAVIWIVRLIQQSRLSLDDAVEILYEEKQAAIEQIRKIKDNPVAEQLLELLDRYNLYSGLPVVRVGSWVFTNAGWGRVDEILNPSTRISVDSFLEGDGKYILSVTMHIYESYDLTGEKAIINMATSEIIFHRTNRIFVCQHCQEFVTAKVEMFKSHLVAVHGNALPYPGERTNIVRLTSIQFNMNPQQNKRDF